MGNLEMGLELQLERHMLIDIDFENLQDLQKIIV